MSTRLTKAVLLALCVSTTAITYRLWSKKSTTQPHRTFDRVVRFDEKSRNYPIREVVGSRPFIDNIWECNAWNDQLAEGACVGFGWGHELNATPEVVPTNADGSRSIYKRAQQLDQWAGENYEGTSVLAGAKAVMELRNNVGQPYLSEYRWAFGLEDLMLALAYQGPVVLGLNWYSGMYNPDYLGFLRVKGSNVGGHCLLALGVFVVARPGYEGQTLTSLDQIDLDKSYIVVHNSWGKDWGVNGRAKITLSDMAILLNQDGEACVPMVRTSDSVVTPPVVTQSYFSVRGSRVFHDVHPGLRPYRWYPSRELALFAGLRPCATCRP